MQETTPGYRPTGWYADPEDPELARYWDGEAWTDDVSKNLARKPPPLPEPSTLSRQAGPPPPPTATRPAPSSPDWYRNPEGPGQRYWDGQQWTENYADDRGNVLNVPPPAPLPSAARAPTGGDSTLAGWGYVLAILFPIIGLIIGIVLLARRNNHGIGVLVVSVIAFGVWAAILAS